MLAALEHRRRTGEGQLIEMAQTEAAAYLLGEFYLEGPCTGSPPRAARQRRRRTPCRTASTPAPGDDRWCAIAVVGDPCWQRFTDALAGRRMPGWATLDGRLAARPEIDARVAEWTRSAIRKTSRRFQAAGVSAMAVLSPDDSRADPHLAARGAIVTVQHPEIGAERHVGNPIRLSRTRLVTDWCRTAARCRHGGCADPCARPRPCRRRAAGHRRRLLLSLSRFAQEAS